MSVKSHLNVEKNSGDNGDKDATYQPEKLDSEHPNDDFDDIAIVSITSKKTVESLLRAIFCLIPELEHTSMLVWREELPTRSTFQITLLRKYSRYLRLW